MRGALCARGVCNPNINGRTPEVPKQSDHNCLTGDDFGGLKLIFQALPQYNRVIGLRIVLLIVQESATKKSSHTAPCEVSIS